jgi:glycosyltransferase involved in cell wall biosynthesis
MIMMRGKSKKTKTKSRKNLSIIIPAHNEENNIKRTVEEIADSFRSAEIIVVANGCTDRTYEVAKKIKRPNVKVVNFYKRIGKGGAIIEGFKIANGRRIGFVDADGSFRVRDIRRIIEKLDDYDVAIASKWKRRDFFEVQSGFGRKIGSRGWNLLTRVFAGIDYNDTQAGLKFFRKEVVDYVIKRKFVLTGFDFDVELLYRIKKGGFDVCELYVPIKDGGKSTFNIRSSPGMFLNLIRFFLNEMTSVKH